MNDALSTIKENLPSGYEKLIAIRVGCSVGTVNNILNGKHSKRSCYKTKIMKEAAMLAKENLQPMQDIADTADAIKSMTSNGSEKIESQRSYQA